MPTSSRPIPQTSTGRLVSISVDNPKIYTPAQQEIPALMPLSTSYANNDSEEKTVLWTNVAALFVKCEQNDENLKSSVSTLTRGSDEMYQELQDVKAELAQVQTDINENNVLSKHVRKLRKYVNKKCEKVREDISYGSSSADHEIFDYIDTLRGEFNTRLQKLEKENTELREELDKLHQTYDNDYDLFIRRENELMAKLDAAININDSINDRVKDHEAIVMKHLGEVHNRIEQRLHQVSGDLREEFARAISREVEFESKASAQLVQSVNDELTELITRSNQYHSHRYFGTVEDVKQLRESCQTLKQSIGMVDAELSDTKEIVEFLKDEVGQASNDIYDVKEEMVDLKEWQTDLKDDVYHELDRDYYDLKDYVKRQVQRHKKQHHMPPQENTEPVVNTEGNGIQLIVNEYQDQYPDENVGQAAAAVEAVTATAPAVAPVAEYREEHVIIIDADTVFSDDEDEPQVTHT
jgi:chromosome segregation ATPase